MDRAPRVLRRLLLQSVGSPQFQCLKYGGLELMFGIGTVSTSTATTFLTSPSAIGSPTNTSTGAPSQYTGAATNVERNLGSVLAFVGFCVVGLVML